MSADNNFFFQDYSFEKAYEGLNLPKEASREI